MRRKFCIAMTLCMLLGTAVAADSAGNTKENVSNNKVFANDPVGITIPTVIMLKRPDDLKPRTDWVKPVRFYHAMHATYHACYDCHHEETNRYMGEDLDGFTPCTDCHADEGMLEPLSFYAAWHAKSPISCVGCHWQNHLKGNEKPPISCTRGCHPDAQLSPQTTSDAAHTLLGVTSPQSHPTNQTHSTSQATSSSASTSPTSPSNTASPDLAWEIAPRTKSEASTPSIAQAKALED